MTVVLRSWRPYVWLFLLGFLTYARTLGFGFSPLDDRWMIVDRLEELKHLSAIPGVFTHAVLGLYYRPVLALSFVIDAISGGGRPFTFHLTNVVLHGLVCATLFAFLLKLELTRGRAFVLAAIFAVHPIHVHAVAWIPGRNDVLLSLFVLGAAVAFIEFAASRAPRALAAHVGCLALALLTKESAAILPLILLCYAAYPPAGTIKPGAAIPAWIAVLAAWALAWRAVVHGGLSGTAWNPGDVLTDAGSGFLVDFGKLILPVQQAVFPTVEDSSLIPGCLALILCAGAVAWRGFADKRKAALGASWFFLFLGPSLLHGSTDAIGEHYEHRLYLPSIGFLLLISQLDWSGVLVSRPTRRIVASVGVLAFAGLLVKTVHRSGTYRDARSIAEAGVRESPRLYHAYGVRGAVLSDAGRYDLAVSDFSRAFELMKPGSANRATLELLFAATLSKQNRPAEAVEHYLKAVEARPDDADARTNLGNELTRLGRLDDAIDQYTNALRIRPRSAQAHNNLGVALMKARRVDEGAREFAEALRLQPDYPGARQNLDRALRLQREGADPGAEN